MRDANQLPLYYCFAGGLVGCVASAVAWWMLGTFLWMPFGRQLRDHGMVADDIGAAMGMIVVPPIMGLAFLVSTLTSLIVVRWIGNRKSVLILLNVVPGLLITLLGVSAILHGRAWSNPGFEIACGLIGIGWGVALYALKIRRSGYIEG